MPAYHIYRISEFYYSFTTEAGIDYECSFTSYKEYFKDYPDIASKVFSFDLYLQNPKQKPFATDKKIAETVIKIVGDFLNSKINAVVYICDTSDGKAKFRARKFKSWFSYYEHDSHQIVQVNADIEAGGLTLHTALLVHRKNKFKKQFVEAYLEITDYDNEPK